EWVHVQLHQQKGMISLSPPTICNSAIKIIAVSDPLVIPFSFTRNFGNDARCTTILLIFFLKLR
ncbi:hypothetical protein NA419_23625, partial [Salmonella sp. NW615]